MDESGVSAEDRPDGHIHTGGSAIDSLAEDALERELDPQKWPRPLALALEDHLGDRHYADGRFVLWLGLAIFLGSIPIDYLVLAERFTEMLAMRLGITLPLIVGGLAMPRSRLGWQKFFAGTSVIAFATILLIGAAWAPPLTGAYLAIGPVLLLGIGAPIMPYSPRELAIFIVAFALATSQVAIHAGGAIMRDPAFFGIVLATMMVAYLLPRRLWSLQGRNFLLARQSARRLEDLEGVNAQLMRLSMTDPLTGLANRRRAQQVFARHYLQPPVPGGPRVAVLMVDLDHFKKFNDRWGHQAGDDCLRAVAGEMRHCAAANGGLAARFGGEEFVAFFQVADAETAMAIAEELRAAVERIAIDHADSAGVAHCTTSIGVAVHTGDGVPKLTDLLGAADAGLYEAKDAGRNRCRLAA